MLGYLNIGVITRILWLIISSINICIQCLTYLAIISSLMNWCFCFIKASSPPEVESSSREKKRFLRRKESKQLCQLLDLVWICMMLWWFLQWRRVAHFFTGPKTTNTFCTTKLQKVLLRTWLYLITKIFVCLYWLHSTSTGRYLSTCLTLLKWITLDLYAYSMAVCIIMYLGESKAKFTRWVILRTTCPGTYFSVSVKHYTRAL